MCYRCGDEQDSEDEALANDIEKKLFSEFPDPVKAGASVAKPYDPNDDPMDVMSETSDDDERVDDGKTLNEVKPINMKRLYINNPPVIHDPDNLKD